VVSTAAFLVIAIDLLVNVHDLHLQLQQRWVFD